MCSFVWCFQWMSWAGYLARSGGGAVNLGGAWFLAATVGVCFVEGGLGAGLRPHLHLWFLTVRKLVRQLEDQVCYSRYQISFYLWWFRPKRNYQKVPKYYDQGCCLIKEIKYILIHEYQHESTRDNTSPTRVRHESTRTNTSPKRVNTTPKWVNTKQHESKTGRDHENEKNMAKRKHKT